MIKLKALLEADMTQGAPASAEPVQPSKPVPTPPQTPQPSGQDSATEYSPAFDFSEFERKLASATETAKNTFQEKLMQKLAGKKVLIRASKGYGQPKKDYTINVTAVSIDFYYERYVVILKDDKDKEYFLETGMKIKVLGAAEANVKKSSPKKPTAPTTPVAPVAPSVAPVEKVPNTATQGI
jgi:hypothetical protein